MTTGSYSLGSTSKIGPYARKSWAGGDNPPFIAPGTKWRDLPPVKDPWTGEILTPKDGWDYKCALVHAKGEYLRTNRGIIPNAANGYYGLHTYDKTHSTAYIAGVKNERTGLLYPYTSLFGGVINGDPWTANDDLKLIDKLREKILGSDFNAGLFLAEVNQTAEMLADDLHTLGQSVEALRHGKYREAAVTLFSGKRTMRARRVGLSDHVVSNYANRQLVWTYGYAPLLSDADAALRYIAWKLNGTPVARVAVSRGFNYLVKPTFPAAGSSASSFGRSSSRCVAYLEHVDQIKLLGLYDIPSILYERTPYSFILDWFVPVGSYLSALNVSRALTGRYVVTKRMAQFWSPLFDVVKSGDTYSGLTAMWWRSFEIHRKVYTTLNVPFPTVKPALRIASAGHCLNAASLLIQQVNRKILPL